MDIDLISRWSQENWATWFHLRRPLSGLPHPQAVEVKTVGDPSYGFRGRQHAHLQHCQVMIGLRGRGWFQRAHQQWSVPVGHAILFDFKDAHIRYRLPDDASMPWQWLRFGFYGADAAVADLVREHPAPIAVGADGDLVRRLQALRHQGPQPLIDPGAGAGLVAAVLDDLVRAIAGADIHRRRRVQVAEALDAWLRQHAAGSHATIAAAAAAAGVSHEHATRCYRDRFHCTPQHRLEGLRLRLAAEKLGSGETTIGAVATALGWSSSSHFARRFRAAFGLAPGEWCRLGCPPLS